MYPCTRAPLTFPLVLSYHVWDSVALALLSSVGLFYLYLIAAASQLHFFYRHIFSFLAGFQMKILHSHTFPFPIAPASVSICFLATLMSCLVDFLLACFWLQYFGRKGWHQSRCVWNLFSYFSYICMHEPIFTTIELYPCFAATTTFFLLQFWSVFRFHRCTIQLPRLLSTQNIKIHRRARRTGKELL